jgi:mannose-1-phosphate guanylyltransferase/mannose-6-phosphate isomerase
MSLYHWHSLGGASLELIKVEIGEYVGEDDIERVEDDFGRI